MDGRETERRRLVSLIKTQPMLERKAAKAKSAWLAAQVKQELQRDLLKDAVKKARQEMDALFARLSDVSQARNTLLAEYTPQELRVAERDTGFAHRTLAMKLTTAEADVASQRRYIAGMATTDADTRSREHDKLVYLESLCADTSTQTDKARASWESAQQGLERAYGRATETAEA